MSKGTARSPAFEEGTSQCIVNMNEETGKKGKLAEISADIELRFTEIREEREAAERIAAEFYKQIRGQPHPKRSSSLNHVSVEEACLVELLVLGSSGGTSSELHKSRLLAALVPNPNSDSVPV